MRRALTLLSGNVVAGQATVTRTNGSITLAETVSVTPDTTSTLELADNSFYWQFTRRHLAHPKRKHHPRWAAPAGCAKR